VEEDRSAPQSRFQLDPHLALTVPTLDELWAHLESNARISDVAAVGRGIEFKSKEARSGVPVVLPHPKPPDYPAGFAGMARGTQEVFATPPLRGLTAKADLIENPRQGMATGRPQVLVNRNRAARNRWRLKAMLDPDGRRVKNNLLVVRPKDSRASALFLWAILNSPIANAFVARDTMKRDNAESAIGKVPIPRLDSRAIDEVLTAARAYRDLATKCPAPTKRRSRRKPDHPLLFQGSSEVPAEPTDSQICDALLAMDAAVLKLYGLPVRLEKQLLDHFRGHKRPGVGCEFSDYFPADFKSLVPLHKCISSAYRRSTVDQVAARVKPGESAHILAALRSAAEAFGEES
jgi:hypothetical protein